MLRWLVVACLVMCACSSDPCEELAEICEKCPADGDGPVARASCLQTVEIGTEEDCQDRLDEDTYANRGCQ
jgi:hypothetical protein